MREVIEKFDFDNTISKLDEAGLLFQVMQRFTDPTVDLQPDHVENATMGTIFEELIRKFNEALNENPGEHFTPRPRAGRHRARYPSHREGHRADARPTHGPARTRRAPAERGRLGVFFRPRALEPLEIGAAWLRQLAAAGAAERISRGLYHLASAEPSEHHTLAAVCARVPEAVHCLLSALRYHELGSQLQRDVWSEGGPWVTGYRSQSPYFSSSTSR